MISLNLDAGALEPARAVLAPDELDRAGRFRFQLHRDRFIRGRAALRHLLGRQLAIAPEHVVLRTLEFGKPVVDTPNGLVFNLAHSEHRAVIVLGEDRQLGVDIELLRALADRDRLAEKNFSAAERQALRDAPEDRRDRLFYSCWTRKEAHLKMLGSGIAAELTAITVGLVNGSEANVPTVLHTLQLGDDALCTVASDRPWSGLSTSVHG